MWGARLSPALFVKIKFTLTFLPVFIPLMCVSVRGSLCACVLYTITFVDVYVYLLAYRVIPGIVS